MLQQYMVVIISLGGEVTDAMWHNLERARYL